jgi:hypothetical protein
MACRGESSRAGWTTEADILDGLRTDADEVERLIATKNTIILLCLKLNCLVQSASRWCK